MESPRSGKGVEDDRSTTASELSGPTVFSASSSQTAASMATNNNPAHVSAVSAAIIASNDTLDPQNCDISFREYYYPLPYPFPDGVKKPYSLGLPMYNPLNYPARVMEPTHTLVLTSAARTFVDLRFFKPLYPGDPQLPNAGGPRDRLEWAFAGRSETAVIKKSMIEKPEEDKNLEKLTAAASDMSITEKGESSTTSATGGGQGQGKANDKPMSYAAAASSGMVKNKGKGKAAAPAAKSTPKGKGKAKAEPHDDPYDVTKGPTFHSIWHHWVDNRYPAFSDRIPRDEADMYPTREDYTLEHGVMLNPYTLQYTSYEEMWRTEPIKPTFPDTSKWSIVLRVEQHPSLFADGKGIRGVVVRVGQYCQGILRVGNDPASVERWEFFEKKDTKGKSKKTKIVDGEWKRTAKIGDLMVPCFATFRPERLSLGTLLAFGRFPWCVEEKVEFE